MSHCVDVSTNFDRESDSFGRLVVTFDDPLTGTVNPQIEISAPAPEADRDVDDFESEPERPPLMAVPDDVWEGF